MRFTKMHGAGNDYIYVNCFEEPVPQDAPELARRIAHRRFGVGADGLVLICPSETADARMRIYNADGSEAEMCGNAIRCVAKYVYDYGICARERLSIETGAGVLTLELEIEQGRVDRVRVDMGVPVLRAAEIPTTLPGDPKAGAPLAVEGGPVVEAELPVEGEPTPLRVTCVSMGNPHCVMFVDALNDRWPLVVGPKIERDARFPRRVNAEFVQVLTPRALKMRVWERGSGETWACGTGACAVAVAGVLTGRCEKNVLIHLLGGDLQIEWAENQHVFMTGPAAEVFSGRWPA